MSTLVLSFNSVLMKENYVESFEEKNTEDLLQISRSGGGIT